MKIVNFNLGQQTDFLTEQEASTLFDSAGTANNAIASHLAATNPHQITPEAIGAASEFYAENLAQDATNAAFAHTNSAIAAHLAATNPHQITPTLIGAALATHTHATSQIIDLGISINTNLINIKSAKIGWGISDNIWQDYGSLNTIFKDINTSSAKFTKTPIYFASLYGNGSHWNIVGANAIYTPTATGFRVYLIMPSYPHTSLATTPSSLTPAYAATNNYRIAWVGIQD